MTDRPDVLVVGAGPTGLTLALQACAHGARVRVVEQRPEQFRPSRALIVHPRTLEVLRPLGVTDALLSRADTAPRARLHLGTRTLAVTLAELDLADCAFPFLAFLRQADAEDVLTRALAAHGVEVERGTRLVGIGSAPGGARVALRGAAGAETVECAAVAACDGVGSSVRTALGIGWPGGRYRREVVLADLDLIPDLPDELEAGVAHVVAGRRGLLFLFALGEGAAWRLLATRPVDPSVASSTAPPTAGDLQALLDEAGLGAHVDRVAWSDRVRLQHRVAEHYRRGAVFLAGDAAHASSPAGGTGMNTGIQDAANLGWKLGLATGQVVCADLLPSYEIERRPVAQQVLALTHLIFWGESATDPLARLARGTLAPLLAPALPTLMRRRRLLAGAVRVLSQFHAGYRDSPLSVEVGPARRLRHRAGDRLPDAAVVCDGRRQRLHELTATPGVHVLLDRDAPPLPAGVTGPHLHVHRLADRGGSGLTAVRPDGHVGFCSARGAAPQLRDWLRAIGAIGEIGTVGASGLSRAAGSPALPTGAPADRR